MKQYEIANVRLSISGADSAFFERRMRAYLADDLQDGDIRITFHAADSITLPEGKHIGEAHRWRWMDLGERGFAAYQWYAFLNRNISLITADRQFNNIDLQLCEFANSLGISNERRSFFAVGEIFHYAILQTAGLVFHASAIDYDGSGILFSAPSGTGKSTHTSLWEKYYPEKTRVINDDTPAIRFLQDTPYAFGTPWSGKTEKNQNIAAPVRAIFFLERAAENRLSEISGADAVSRMLNEVRKSVFPEMMTHSLDMINRLLQSVPVYVLHCNISKEAVDLVRRTLDI